MNKPIPNAPLLLSLAGLAPFFWGALTLANTDLMAWSQMWLGKGFVGAQVQISYSAVIMSFMSGVLWGFSTKTTQLKAAICYTLSVLPALAVFFLISTNSSLISSNLFFISSLALLFRTLKDKSSNSSLILCMPILSANGP